MDPQVLKRNDPNINFNEMEKALAREMAQMNIENVRKKRELEKIARESDEIKELKGKILAAKLNKERTG